VGKLVTFHYSLLRWSVFVYTLCIRYSNRYWVISYLLWRNWRCSTLQANCTERVLTSNDLPIYYDNMSLCESLSNDDKLISAKITVQNNTFY